VGSFDGSFKNSWGSNPVTVYYPATSTGAVDKSGAPYPAIVYLGGSDVGRDYYTWVGNLLAAGGYVVAVAQVPHLSDGYNFQQWADGFKGGITYLQGLNSGTGKLAGTMSGLFGIGGHSSGADGVLLAAGQMAAAQDSRIKAVVSHSAQSPLQRGCDTCGVCNSNNRACDPVYEAAKLINVPVQLQAGSDDLLVNPPETEYFYPVLKAPKEFVNICGTVSPDYCAGHLSFTDFYLDNVGVAQIKKYTKNWFDYYLKGDMNKYTYLFGQDAQADLTKKVLTKLNFTE
jgi:predicted dienelactone hydrolase